MLNHKNHQNLLIGVAVAAGLLGSLTGLGFLSSRKEGKRWSNRARRIANQVVETGDVVNKRIVFGGVAGGLLGAATALLLAPKSGAELINDVAHFFSKQNRNVRSAVSRATSHKKEGVLSTKKKRAVHKEHPKTVEKKGKKALETKKTPVRRRTAKTTRLQKVPVPTIQEKESMDNIGQ